MAESYTKYKKEIKEYLTHKYKKEIEILDVGAGEGTYYTLLKSNFRNIDAVEVFKPNIEKYDLESKYRKVYNKDIREFRYKYYDLVIFGDVLEHLETEEAQEVLKYALQHSIEVLVAVPYLYEQGIMEDNVYEIHKQADLTPSVMQKRYPSLELLYGDDKYGYYVKKGSIRK